ncbi:TPA: sortase B protein-sorting domain-containing protein [Clostridium perfringens]|nr:sortase B protein-sorting domain-containing protein [Clostridium perfringens]
METKKIRNKILMAIVALSFILLPNTRVYATENTAKIPLIVRQEFDVYTKDSKAIDMIGKYELKAISENAPMPEKSKNGSFIFNIDGNDKQFTIPLAYTHGGVYIYQIQQITQSKDNYIYDKNSYKITVYVKNAENNHLIPQIIVKNENNEKCEEICFYNIYKQKNKINEISKTPYKPNGINVPKTGDNTNIGFYIVILIISLGLLMVLKWKEYKKRKKE